MGEMIRKFRLLTVDQFEKEQDYFKDMSAKGLHFTGYKFPFYIFERGEAGTYQYQVDFQNATQSDRESYLQLFQDDGWEFVFEYPGVYGTWFYFRKAIKENDTQPHIYTDVQSKIDMYHKIRTNWTLFFLLLFVPLILPNLHFGFRGSALSIFVLILWLCIGLIYLKMAVGLTVKIKRLRRERRH